MHIEDIIIDYCKWNLHLYIKLLSRIRPKCSIKDMGTSISVMEFKGCKSYKIIQKQDSLDYLNTHSLTIIPVMAYYEILRYVGYG